MFHQKVSCKINRFEKSISADVASISTFSLTFNDLETADYYYQEL